MSILLMLSFLMWGNLASCSSDDNDSLEPIAFVVGHESDGMTFLRNGGERQLNIQAPSAPSVSADQPWITVTEPRLNGTSAKVYVVGVTAAENPGYENREATITVTCGNETKTLKVSQGAGEGIVLVSTSFDKEVPANGGDLEIKFQATSDYAVSVSGAVTRKESRSLTDYTECFVVQPNYSSSSRDIDITISLNIDPSRAINVHLTQMPSDASVSGLTAMQLAARMTNGINIGNTLEATGGETSWGAEPINQAYIHGIHEAGFDAVRIPCSWDIYMDENGQIDPAWMDRVYEVVGYCISEGLYVLLNDHWDGGWLENDIPNGYKQEKADRLTAMWTQIAERMAEFDQRLMFAGLNEPNAEKTAAIQTLCRYEQVFVDAVRATGGNNLDRVLVIQAPNTSLELAVNASFTLPTDPTANRLMVETHFYGPYNFTLMEKDESWGKTFWFWGKDNHLDGSDRNPTWGEEAWVKEQCQLMYNRFTVNGIPSIMGEYGCMVRNELKGTEYWDLHQKSRRDWSECVVRESKLAGIVPFNWDTPGGIIDRRDGHVTDQPMVDAILKGAQSSYPF